jgi:hypothetical protein
MLDEREIFLRASFNVEIKEVEDRLQNDVVLIHEQHEGYVELFKELKALYDRFGKSIFTLTTFYIAVSTDVGIISNSKMAWELSAKTNSHVNQVMQKQNKLYVI